MKNIKGSYITIWSIVPHFRVRSSKRETYEQAPIQYTFKFTCTTCTTTNFNLA